VKPRAELGDVQLEFYDAASAPDEEAVVCHGFGCGNGADDDAVFDPPKLRITIPASKVFAV
jgi:hypothetical protein